MQYNPSPTSTFDSLLYHSRGFLDLSLFQIVFKCCVCTKLYANQYNELCYSKNISKVNKAKMKAAYLPVLVCFGFLFIQKGKKCDFLTKYLSIKFAIF